MENSKVLRDGNEKGVMGSNHSPGPLSLARQSFGDGGGDDDIFAYRSFSHLLASAITSPPPASNTNSNAFTSFLYNTIAAPGPPSSSTSSSSSSSKHASLPPLSIPQTCFITLLSSGLSPGALLQSPPFLSASQASFGLSHQQALAQVQAQAEVQVRQTSCQEVKEEAGSIDIVGFSKMEPDSTEIAITDEPTNKLGGMPLPPAEKPSDDGYNWRKYGQKTVKGSEYPRSYHKCTHPKCPVTKKVERSHDGNIIEIVYKGEHSHQKPQHNRRSSDAVSDGRKNANGVDKEFEGNSQQTSYSSDDEGEEVDIGGRVEGEGDWELHVEEEGNKDDCEEPNFKRRKKEKRIQDLAVPRGTVKEPRIVVQTTSDVDILDDGYRWRKYGQKVVKGNHNPRSYYKCTNAGCNVRKHVERASDDVKAVITTYEGKHNHEVPASRNNNHSSTSAPLASQFVSKSASIDLLDQQRNAQ